MEQNKLAAVRKILLCIAIVVLSLAWGFAAVWAQ
jgi:hypothetical protein